ncbi:hypothetical protein Zmor_011136 [Zophobas morio]|uniref:Uncharacterized protein n=1 Tax=Zophobas morio TaxID=2755281 RepID=A0AA38ILK4_9CUCU|nr:hypothetical protein Zmor_011136 [Zophobas morio]
MYKIIPAQLDLILSFTGLTEFLVPEGGLHLNPYFSSRYSALIKKLVEGHLSLGTETWLHCESDRWHANYGLEAMAQVEECQSTPALLESSLQPQISSTSLGMIAEHSLLESCTRLSISLEQNGLFQGNNTSHSSSASHSSRNSQNYSGPKMTLEELRAVNRYAESTRSLSYLPQVHERQTERMKTRSQWFLAPSVECTSCGGSLDLPLNETEVSVLTNAILRRSSSGTIVGVAGLSLSAESVQKKASIRRSNSRDKRHYLHRSTSRRNKENGSRSNSFKGRSDRKGSTSRPGSFKIKYENISRSCSFKTKTELCTCPTGDTADESKATTAKKNETICVTLTYKPRI